MSTAISRIYTQEGFVIASDSRNALHRSDGTVSFEDGVQKIFPMPRHRLCYAVGGTAAFYRINDGSMALSVLPLIAEAVESFDPARVADWTVPGAILSATIRAKLNELRIRESDLVPWKQLPKTEMFVTGYWAKQPVSLHIQFGYVASQIISELTYDAPDEMDQFGSIAVLKELKLGQNLAFTEYLDPPRHSITSFAAAIERCQKDILVQSSKAALELDERMCRNIGGSIHIATITPDAGFQWLSAPKAS